jgi:ATP-binding cassette subfamily B protein RaxB
MIEIDELRATLGTSGRGVTLETLVIQAARLGLNARPLRLELEELAALSMPCILHWDLNHFVVLRRLRRGRAEILDPAVGVRRLRLDEVSEHFTGVALELEPGDDFEKRPIAPRVRLAEIAGRVVGLRRSLLQIGVVALVLELFALAAPMYGQVVVDDAVLAGDRSLLLVLALGFGILLAAQTAIGFARSWMVLTLGQSLGLRWSANLFSHLLRLPLSYFERRHLGDVVSRFGSLAVVQRAVTTSAVEAALDGVMALATAVMMLLYAPSLALVTCVAVAAYAALRWALYAALRDALAERIVLAAREQSHFLETLRAMTPLRLYGGERRRLAHWQNMLVDVQNRDFRTALLGLLFASGNSLIFGLENIVVLALGAGLVIDGVEGAGAPGAFTVGMLLAYVSYKSTFARRTSAFIDWLVQLRMLRMHAERLADIAFAEPEPDASLDWAWGQGGLRPNAVRAVDTLVPSLELRGVGFRYSAVNPWVFRGVDLKVEAGQRVAIVGPSGSGKSTLMKVALGLLEPTEGEVFYGGVEVGSLGRARVRKLVGAVLQDDCLLTGSVAQNIAFFDEQPDLARVEASAHLACIDGEIGRLPMGYETLVGDIGAGLSGGQRQRLLLARALYRAPRILALDEATSHLDIPTERRVAAALAGMPFTRITIAHRPETIKAADRVLVLDAGRLVERLGSEIPEGPQP